MIAYEAVLQQMADNAGRVRAMMEGVSLEQARWKPAPDSWSLLEVINHLNDEEREDFRVRLEIILHHPDRPWPPIDPQGWVKARGYNERQPGESLANYLEARRDSITWLESQAPLDLDRVYESAFGSMRAGDILAAWVAHDGLHLRQMVELQRAYLETALMPYDLSYAGEW